MRKGHSDTNFEREKKKELNKKYWDKNRELLNRKRRLRYLKNREVELAKVKEYQENNKDKIREQSKIYRSLNKEKIRERRIIYRILNKDKIRESKRRCYIKRTIKRANEKWLNEEPHKAVCLQHPWRAKSFRMVV